MNKNITEREWYLIATIRNYRKTYPPSIALEKEIQDMVDVLTDKEFDVEETEELNKNDK